MKIQLFKRTISDSTFTLIITLVYAAFVIALSQFHEVWRDEVMAMSIVTDADSLWALYGSLKNTGHPGLWYTLLYLGYLIYPKYAILKIVNLLICILATFLFLKKAPFRWPVKILFILGVFPLYIYPIINRNYGISMLMIFLVCIFYKNRWQRMIPLSIALCLLANCHIHSTLIVCAFALSLGVELFLFPDAKKIFSSKKAEILLGFLIIFLGIFATLYQNASLQTVHSISAKNITITQISQALFKAFVLPGKYFYSLSGFKSALFVNIIIFATYIYLLRRLNLFVLFAGAVVALSLFFELIYPGFSMRHQGALYLLLVMVLWLDHCDPYEENKVPRLFHSMNRYMPKNMMIFFTCILIIHMCMGYVAVKREILKPYSSSKNFADFIRAHPNLKDAIIISEPEDNIESLPYYLDNPLYFYKEDFIGKQRYLSKPHPLRDARLSDVLAAAKRLKSEKKRDVIIVLDEKVTLEGPFYIKRIGHESFTGTHEELEEFSNNTIFLAEFSGAIVDENYQVFLLK